MKRVQYLNRIRQIDNLIRLKSTGPPKVLSEKLGVSEKSVYRCVNDLKLLGAPIKYNRQQESYVYKDKSFSLSSYMNSYSLPRHD